ncbi:hypothetical protein INR49_021972 [Caranx melampygus]|nr:hypothetical protein INR49_021972 [Caranx melampygus]
MVLVEAEDDDSNSSLWVYKILSTRQEHTISTEEAEYLKTIRLQWWWRQQIRIFCAGRRSINESLL